MPTRANYQPTLTLPKWHAEVGEQGPALVIGLPVGFVNAAESKADLMAMDYPSISNLGRKGGSTIAASVVNALVKLTTAKLS